MSFIADSSRETIHFFSDLKKELVDLHKYRYVCISHIRTRLKQRYRRSVIGFMWTVLAPLAHYAIMGFVMSHLGRLAAVDNYFAYMFTGSVFFSVLGNVINQSPLIMLQNENFIKKIYLPKLIFVLNTTGLEFTNFFLSSFALLILGIAVGGVHPSLPVLIVPYVIVLAFFFCIGVACLISIAAVFFRDLLHILPAVMQAAFFATPIMYDINVIPERYHVFIKLNPLYYFIECFRLPIVSQVLPPTKFLIITTGLSAFVFCWGLVMLKKYDNRIIFKL